MASNAQRRHFKGASRFTSSSRNVPAPWIRPGIADFRGAAAAPLPQRAWWAAEERDSPTTLLGRSSAPCNPAAVLGVEIDAEIIEQILLQDFLRRPDWAAGAELVYILVLGAALILCLRFGAAVSGAFAAAVLAAALAFSWYSSPC